MCKTNTERITTVTQWDASVVIDTHETVRDAYAHVRRVVEYAMDMDDNTNAALLCAFWTDDGTPLSTEQLYAEAYQYHDRDEVTQ